MIPITLRLPTEMRLCQVAIISYTRWPLSAIPGGHFSIPLNPAPQGLIAKEGHNTSTRS